MRVAAKGLRNDLLQLRFDVIDRLPRCQAGAVADPEDVRVDRKCFLSECCIQDNIRGLSTDAGKRLELLARPRHLAAVVIDQRLAQRDDVLRLGVEQTDRLDRVAQLVLAECDHLLRRLDPFEQRLRGDVDAGVRRLSGEHDCDQQSIGIDVIELRGGRRVSLRETAKEFEHLLSGHLSSSRAAPRRLSASSNSPAGNPKPTRKWSGISNQRPGTTAAS